jgi:hypothetical protein
MNPSNCGQTAKVATITLDRSQQTMLLRMSVSYHKKIRSGCVKTSERIFSNHSRLPTNR